MPFTSIWTAVCPTQAYIHLINLKALYMKGYTCYLPANLDVDALLAGCPPERIKNFNRDKLIYTMGLVNLISANNKDLWTPNGIVPVNAEKLQSHIRNYNQYLDYAIQTNIYQSDNFFIKGRKSIGYKYSEKYNTTINPVPLKEGSFIKNIRKVAIQDYVNQKRYNYLYKWFNPKLKFDREKAMDCVLDLYNKDKEENPIHAWPNMKRNLINIDRINNNDYFHSVDSTVGRFHSNITLLKSELRQFLSYDNQPLISLDISNAQPYFSTILLNPEFWKPTNQSALTITYNTVINISPHKFNFNLPLLIILVNQIDNNDYEDVLHYREIVSKGWFYEYLQGMAELKLNKPLSRKYIKQEVLKAFNSANAYKTPVKEVLKSSFPHVYELFSIIKENDKSNLSHLLLNLESIVIIKRLTKEISRKAPGLPLFTIHDCICSTPAGKEILTECTKNIMTKTFEYEPILKLEQ
jgi:hypothetical protein